jgi:hypothetical protein
VEPGGRDIVCLFGGPGEDALYIVERAIREVWPEAVVDAPEKLERLIYENEAARKSWEKHGAVPENLDTMIYLIAEPYNAITMVVDHTSTPAAQAALKALAGIALSPRPGPFRTKKPS